ncbi:Ca2+-binding protein, EF-hand superfamily [Sphingomonas palmae]|uniref:Ca2+-binding protein, EF-hand superfamily n=1 Tax=Sphingomonas palmae TaxID=1855283 RepID=A0A1H7KLS1_9SPHN|nr:EF-hand domain-containing protein [Sphingomonas palmae]SEK87781.1 Ca2+-binding protein, EF-hand superfamily [Sphingomonas palmae]
MIAALLALALQAAAPAADPEIVVRAPLPGTPQTPATMVVEPVAMMIATFDADGDGLVDRSEMQAGVRRSFEAIDTAKSGYLRYIAFADWAERWLGDRNALPSPFEVDRNQDDRVSLDELQNHFSRLFARYDKNGDKRISRAELVTYRTGPVDAKGPTAGRPMPRPAPPPEKKRR